MTNIIYGSLYFLAVPTTSMLMLIYALGNLHVTSWGTRESNKVKKGKNVKVEENDDNCSCFGLCRYVPLYLVHIYVCFYIKAFVCITKKTLSVNIPNKVHCRDTYFILIFLLE